MAAIENVEAVLEEIRKVRQARYFEDRAVPDELVQQLLEVARWCGSARNSQPWRFVVMTDKAQLKAISDVRSSINWVAGAPLAIALVFVSDNPTVGYDEGRVTERILTAASLLGLGGGTAWFLSDDERNIGADVIGVPEGMFCRSVVVIGYPTTLKDLREGANIPGRMPLDELVSYGRYGQAKS
jgi:nitroreductase